MTENNNYINEYFEKYHIKKYAYLAYIIGISKELENEIKSDLFLKKIEKPTLLNILRSLNESDYSEVMNKSDYKNLIKNMLCAELTKVFIEEFELQSKKERTTLIMLFLRARKLIFAYEGDEFTKKSEIFLKDNLDCEEKAEKFLRSLSGDCDKLLKNEKKISKIKKFSVNNYSILAIITFLYLCSVVIFMPNGYGVYQLLRWVVTSFSAWTAFKIYKKSPHDFSMMIFSAIAILFNPILPIKFEQEVWLCIDVLTALAILTYAIKSLRAK